MGRYWRGMIRRDSLPNPWGSGMGGTREGRGDMIARLVAVSARSPSLLCRSFMYPLPPRPAAPGRARDTDNN